MSQWLIDRTRPAMPSHSGAGGTSCRVRPTGVQERSAHGEQHGQAHHADAQDNPVYWLIRCARRTTRCRLPSRSGRFATNAPPAQPGCPCSKAYFLGFTESSASYECRGRLALAYFSQDNLHAVNNYRPEAQPMKRNRMDSHQWDIAPLGSRGRFRSSCTCMGAGPLAAGDAPVLLRHGLSVAEFDVLATLRNAPAPYEMTPRRFSRTW